ncbi:MAG: bifunctional glutamate N-acetyltransferase/amino-acid acetyltransferase ArgJ [Gammaproteobacteria bacterium]|nr:bifunctional glutamate N-acetyltransferase/amino-acid acetyltransferase ArgJ [Gammaproteobacteria bacterium]
MAVGLKPIAQLQPVPGIRASGLSARIKKSGKPDLALIELATGSSCAALFTRNAFCAAPVVVARQHLAATSPRLLLINSGNANAGTGELGLQDSRNCCETLAAAAGLTPEQILPFSTGVIGERLPTRRIQEALPELVAELRDDGWNAAAEAIMTTDTLAKGVSHQTQIGSTPITITGITKGSGMIRPDMATLLAFVATDANVTPQVLDECLRHAVARSFNRITVDGDTSTNDACVLIATGRADMPAIEQTNSTEADALRAGLNQVFSELAQAVVRDGEGATKFVTIDVTGAINATDASELAYTVAHSPLVKTALFASDPNWGRILAAVGRAPLQLLLLERVSIHLGSVCIVRNGAVAEDYSEAAGQAVMDQPEITITIDLGVGEYQTRVWTSDLSYDYVKINAEYRS